MSTMASLYPNTKYFMGTEIFERPEELGIRTVKQQQEIEFLQRKLNEKENMQYQFDLSGGGYVGTAATVDYVDLTPGKHLYQNVDINVSTKKDTNKIKNLIAYYYKR